MHVARLSSQCLTKLRSATWMNLALPAGYKIVQSGRQGQCKLNKSLSLYLNWSTSPSGQIGKKRYITAGYVLMKGGVVITLMPC